MSQRENVIHDSILAGILISIGISVLPFVDDVDGQVRYRIEGDLKSALDKIYSNQLVGARDVLQGIKAARQAIFALREGAR